MASSIVVPQIELAKRPSNAGWLAKLETDVDLGLTCVVSPLVPPQEVVPHMFNNVALVWYDSGLKVVVKKGGPAVIAQAYLAGKHQDVIIDLRPIV